MVNVNDIVERPTLEVHVPNEDQSKKIKNTERPTRTCTRKPLLIILK